ncbi:MAG: GntR family transcriptional regulator [Lachnospiraceae bacterium]|nr:GntR family transcriptional regulator [Lachnospiraceae bacterium]
MKIIHNNGVPIYQQIADDFQDQIMNGKLEPGKYLPSIRSLAKDLKISVITTKKAYEVLEEEGLVTSVPGKGFYINSIDTEMMREQHQRKVEEALSEAIHAANVAGMTKQDLIDTLTTLLDLEDEGRER